MAVPKGKVSKERKHKRNSANFKAEGVSLVECPKCHEMKEPHKVCKKCGTYKNNVVIEEKKKETK